MVQVIPFHKQQTSEWTGGTTTQLFIFPPGSLYTERDFKVRISTATIRIPQSCFTALPGFNRILMVLEGSLTITHQEAHTIQLQPFDTDHFSGNWQTSSEGLATDFNIIHKPEAKASLRARVLQPEQIHEAISSPAYTHWFLYQGQGTVSNADETLVCNTLDACLITPHESLTFEASTNCILIESILYI